LARKVDILGMIKILLAHSDPKLIDLYKPFLSRHFEVDSASQGLAALRKIQVTSPSLIVSDYHLPLLSGLTLLKFVRNHSVLGAIPFMFLTNHSNPHQALSFGANDWLAPNTTTPNLLVEKIYHQLKLNRYAQ